MAAYCPSARLAIEVHEQPYLRSFFAAIEIVDVYVLATVSLKFPSDCLGKEAVATEYPTHNPMDLLVN
jgi:hypothetical protein